jgi:carbon starvation protein CstA
MHNKYVTTALVVVFAYLIGATDGWQKIWPIFGATNQLIAAVALFVISTYLIGAGVPVFHGTATELVFGGRVAGIDRAGAVCRI